MIFYFLFVSTVSATAVTKQNDTCPAIRDSLAVAVANFTSCAIQHSRPITLCESCVTSYLTVLDSYNDLKNEPDADNKGHCIDDYVDQDRLQIVETLYKNSYDLWNRAKCYECFAIVNGSLTPNPSEETTLFSTLLNETMHCINESGNNQTIFCQNCIDEYLDLNTYYISISNVYEKIGVCMDIVDLMNDTRAMWSKKCCNYRKHNDYILLVATGTVTFLTIGFYILAKLCTDMRKPEIYLQSRFPGSLTNIDDSNSSE